MILELGLKTRTTTTERSNGWPLAGRGRQPARPRALGGFSLPGVCVLLLLASHAAAQPARNEYEVKAALLQKLALFVEWPASSTATNTAPFTIGILGEDPFKFNLEAVLSQKLIRGRALKFCRLATIQDAIQTNCHLLFIAASEKGRLPEILNTLKTTPILTVGDTPGFGEKGVMINLDVVGERLRFEINETTAEQAGLRISSQLLGVASTVHRRPKAPK